MDDLEEIRQLKARYFRTLDTKDWAAFRLLFTDDVTVDTSESGGGTLQGADRFVSFLQQTLAGAVTVHHGHMPKIRLTSASTATGTWALQDVILWPDGTRMQGYGHYHETYESVGGQWRITSLVLTRLHTEVTPPGA